MKVNGVHYMSDKEACNFYGVSPSWFRNARYRGNGPVYIRFGGRVFYKQSVVDKWFIEYLEKGER